MTRGQLALHQRLGSAGWFTFITIAVFLCSAFLVASQEDGFELITATPEELTSRGNTRVFGIVFNVRTKTSAALQLTGFEFYTSAETTIYYQLRSRHGSYTDHIGDLDAFDVIAEGVLNGAGACSSSEPLEDCKFTVIPDEDWTDPYVVIEGRGDTRAFYMTLVTNGLLTWPGSGSKPDTVVSKDTAEMEIYEGLATLTYPFVNNAGFYLSTPVAFLGKLSYTTLSPPPSASPVTRSPFSGTASPTDSPVEPPTSTPSYAPTQGPTVPPPTAAPSKSPTQRCRLGRPCPPPPTPPPTPPPLSPTISPTAAPPALRAVNFIIMLENVPNRFMRMFEVENYLEVVTLFLTANPELKSNGVFLHNVTVFHYDLIDEGRGRVLSEVPVWRTKERFERSSGSSSSSSGGPRLPNEVELKTQGLLNPSVYPAIYVMTTVEVFAKLPQDVVQYFLQSYFTRNATDLVQLFKDNSAFVSYFREVTNITTLSVSDDHTLFPTPSPTSIDEAVIKEIDQEEASRFRIGQYALIVFGAIWIILTIYSLRQIWRFRKRSKNDQMLGGNSGNDAYDSTPSQDDIFTSAPLGTTKGAKKGKSNSWKKKFAVKGVDAFKDGKKDKAANDVRGASDKTGEVAYGAKGKAEKRVSASWKLAMDGAQGQGGKSMLSTLKENMEEIKEMDDSIHSQSVSENEFSDDELQALNFVNQEGSDTDGDVQGIYEGATGERSMDSASEEMKEEIQSFSDDDFQDNGNEEQGQFV